MTSPYRRTRETGEIAFGEQNIEVNANLAHIDYLRSEDLDSEQQKIKEDLIKTLETLPSNNLNKVLIAHLHSFDNSQNDLPHMGTVVLKPKDQGKGYEFIGLINPKQFIN